MSPSHRGDRQGADQRPSAQDADHESHGVWTQVVHVHDEYRQQHSEWPGQKAANQSDCQNRDYDTSLSDIYEIFFDVACDGPALFDPR